MSKVLELVVLHKIDSYLYTTDNQFGFKGRGWSKTGVCYQIFSSSSLCDVTPNYKMSAHLHNLCMDFPQFQSAKRGALF